MWTQRSAAPAVPVAGVTRHFGVTTALAGVDRGGRGRAVRELLGLTGQFAAVDEILSGRENP